MKKFLFLGMLSWAFGVLQAETLQEALKQAKVDGEVKVVHYSRDATNSAIFGKANGTAIGGNIGLSTHAINNVTFNTRIYTTNALRQISGNASELANTNLVNGTKNYVLLGEINLAYDDGVNALVVGRQALHTPLVGSDDARVVKDLFEAVNFSTKLVPDTTLHALYIHKNSGMDNGDSNYNSAVNKNQFVSMSKTLGASYDKGMAVLGIENSMLENLKLSMWYYDSFDLVKMLYYDAAYTFPLADEKSFTLEGHYWTIKSKSRYELDTNKKIDYNYGGVRANYKDGGLLLQIAREHIHYADKTVGIHTAWGMFTEYTYGYLIGSGIYGAINGFGGQYITKLDASKLTLRYDFGNGVDIYTGYDIYKGDNDAFMSDMNLLDLYVGFPCQLVKNAKWGLLYEYWDSGTNNIMVDNNLLRLKFTYSF